MENKNQTLATIAIISIILSVLSLFWAFVVSVGAASEIKDLKRQLQTITVMISPAPQTSTPPTRYEMSIGELQITTKDGTQFSLKDFEANGNKEDIDQIFNGLELK